jgi:hypothetical protein
MGKKESQLPKKWIRGSITYVHRSLGIRHRSWGLKSKSGLFLSLRLSHILESRGFISVSHHVNVKESIQGN